MCIKQTVIISKCLSKKASAWQAFSFAEILLTILIIGVIAMLTISPLSKNVNDSTVNKQNKTFAVKFEEGLQVMRLREKLAQTYDTASFVQEMTNFFSISQVCDSDNLGNCFSQTIGMHDEKNEDLIFNVANMKDANKVNSKYPKSPIYGIRFSNGVSMLVSYIPDCVGPDKTDINGDTKKCLLYLYDVNSNKSPNFYAGPVGGGSALINVANAQGSVADISGNMAILGNPYGLSYNVQEIGATMTWAKAEEHCAKNNLSLPDLEKAKEIAEKLFVDSGYCSYYQESSGGGGRYYCSDEIKSDPLWTTLMENASTTGGNIAAFYFWTNETSGNNAYDCIIGLSDKGYYWWGCYSNPKSTGIVNVMCIE